MCRFFAFAVKHCTGASVSGGFLLLSGAKFFAMATATVRPSWLSSHIGRKVLTAATGLFMIIFLVEHLIGNLLLLAGDGGVLFNQYTYDMTHNPLIKVVEVVLFGSILGHVVLAVTMNLKAMAARKTRYKVYKPAKKVPFASRFMLHTGLVFLVWLVIHLMTFFYSRITTDVEELIPGNATPYDEVVHKFSNPVFAIFYVVAMLIMAVHLSHGLFSALQTLGLTVNKRVERVARIASWGFAVVVSLGFAIIPLAVLYQN